MEPTLAVDDAGWSVTDSEGSAIAVGESGTDVMAPSAAEVTTDALVVCGGGVVAPLPQDVSGTAINASRTNERRILRP